MKSTALMSHALVSLLIIAGCGETAPSVPVHVPSRVLAHESTVLTPSESAAEQKSPGDIAEDIEVAPLQPLFRPDDARPAHDVAQLAAAGIHRYTSNRLILYTDLDPELAATLPSLADQLYDALVAYFGPLPQARDGHEFQVTGYLIRDEALFREQGLLEGLPVLHHGKHIANRFWMRDQQQDYYRRHLMLHEFTHCYMTIMPGAVPPVWYMEGMAEIFGTHRLLEDGTAEFRILPDKADNVSGWGRIESIRQESAAGRSLTLGGVFHLGHDAFFKPQAYAWSWGVCQFLDRHPRTKEAFRQLGQHLSDGEFVATFQELLGNDLPNLNIEWELFEFQVQPGYDIAAAAIDFKEGVQLATGETKSIELSAARGWQDAGLQIEPGMELKITATGRCTLAEEPKPWVSEPQGITVRYFNGQPLGCLVTCFIPDSNSDMPPELVVVPVGKSARLPFLLPGRLLLRINDRWDDLRNNSGRYQVTVERGI